MGARQLKDLTPLQLFTMDDVSKMTTYHRKTIEKFSRDGVLKTRLLNDGKRVTTKKWIIEFLNAISDGGPLEF